MQRKRAKRARGLKQQQHEQVSDDLRRLRTARLELKTQEEKETKLGHSVWKYKDLLSINIETQTVLIFRARTARSERAALGVLGSEM